MVGEEAFQVGLATIFLCVQLPTTPDCLRVNAYVEYVEVQLLGKTYAFYTLVT